MQTVETFQHPEEANVARSFLAANGIDAIIAGEQSLSVMPFIGEIAKSYQLMVPDDDVAAARELLAGVSSANSTMQEQAPPAAWSGRRAFMIIALLVAIFLAIFGNGYSRAESGTSSLSPIDYLICFITNGVAR